MERVQPVAPREDEPASAAKKPHEALPPLIAEARASRDMARRRELATQINALLVKMREPGDEAAEAAMLVSHLDANRLHQLADEKGRNCRTVAVQTLLALGFPHALHVSPEDLALAKQQPEPDHHEHDDEDAQPVGEWVNEMRSTRRNAFIVTVAGHAGILLAAAAQTAQLSTLGVLMLPAVLSMLASLWLVVSPPDPQKQVAPLVMTAMATLLALACGIAFPIALFGVLVNGLAAFVALNWQSAPASHRAEWENKGRRFGGLE